MSHYISKRNGKKGGRPNYSQEKRAKIQNIDFVVLTSSQCITLINKYGKALFFKALKVLEQWLKTSPEGEKYRGKNNYAHFRSDGWVINAARGK